MNENGPLPDPPEWDWRQEKAEREAKRADVNRPQHAPKTQAVYERSLGIGIAIGYSFVGPVLAGILLGLWLDGWEAGGYTILGLLLGMAGALALLIRLVARLNREA